MTIVLVPVCGAIGAVIGYRLIADGRRWDRLLCVALITSVLFGAVARMARLAGDSGVAALPVALLGPIVTFVGVGWLVRSQPWRAWGRAAVVVAGAVAAAILGYLSIDLLGLAYIKFPRIG